MCVRVGGVCGRSVCRQIELKKETEQRAGGSGNGKGTSRAGSDILRSIVTTSE